MSLSSLHIVFAIYRRFFAAVNTMGKSCARELLACWVNGRTGQSTDANTTHLTHALRASCATATRPTPPKRRDDDDESDEGDEDAREKGHHPSAAECRENHRARAHHRCHRRPLDRSVARRARGRSRGLHSARAATERTGHGQLRNCRQRRTVVASIAIKEISAVLERIGVLNRLAVDDPGTTGTLPEGPALRHRHPQAALTPQV